MTQKVTKRQQAVLDCIEACIREKGYGPTVREVCQSLGLSSPSTVHVHLKALEDKGFIKRDPLKSRSIALTYPIEEVPSPVTAFAAAYSKLVNVPLVGNVAAGSPILAEENITDTITLPTDIVGDAPSFMLSVRGESMIEAGINDGDYVVVKEQRRYRRGHHRRRRHRQALLPRGRPYPPATGELGDGPHHHDGLLHCRQGGGRVPAPVALSPHEQIANSPFGKLRAPLPRSLCVSRAGALFRSGRARFLRHRLQGRDRRRTC